MPVRGVLWEVDRHLEFANPADIPSRGVLWEVDRHLEFANPADIPSRGVLWSVDLHLEQDGGGPIEVTGGGAIEFGGVSPAVSTAPPAPTGLTLGLRTLTSITVSWTDQSSGAAWHRVYFRTAGSAEDYEVAAELPPETVEATVAGLDEATAYQIRATAFNAESTEESDFTSSLEVSTLGPPAEGGMELTGGGTILFGGVSPGEAAPAAGGIQATGGGSLTFGGLRPDTNAADLSPELMARII